jgi:hypothetical protein
LRPAPTRSRRPRGYRLDAFSIVEGHEYAESITDPQLGSGYVDSGGAEIGDACESDFQMINLATGATGSFAVQPLWSNNANACPCGDAAGRRGRWPAARRGRLGGFTSSKGTSP